MHKQIEKITKQITARSEKSRAAYLSRIEKAATQGPNRAQLPCGNLAHGFAACSLTEKADLRGIAKPNIAIISSYNDMLSAHKPYENFPALLKEAIRQGGGVAQFAGGVPAMCDGITQGQTGMELSLMSRDVIALSAAVALSHNMFDGGLMLGICDKIVPGLLLAALSFGHLPFIFIPAGPMPSGIANQEKAKIRQLFAQGKVEKEALLDAEAASYHSQGTCTFYGTANSNQLIMEVMGLHLPGASFVAPTTMLRKNLTKAAALQVLELTSLSAHYLPIGKLVTAKTIVNAIVALLSTGGSTNHTLHLVAIAKAAGFIINWDDFSNLSSIVPLITKIYPNGYSDINHFQQAGGMAYLIHTLLEAGLLHNEVSTVVGYGLEKYTQEPLLDNEELIWREGPKNSSNTGVLTSVTKPFKANGGLQVLTGNIGRAIFKTSALKEEDGCIEAPAVVFYSQQEVEQAFKAGELNKNCVVVLPFQGPKACGMPELHQLTPILGVLQDKGFKVALVTDGRMSGASGRVPAAIHVTPEARDGGVISKIKTGDRILIDGEKGLLQLGLSEEELAARKPVSEPMKASDFGMGREMFLAVRQQLSGAEEGACSLFAAEQKDRV